MLRGQYGAAALSALFHGGQEGQELPFILNSFNLNSCEGAFPSILDSFIQENFSWGKPQTPN